MAEKDGTDAEETSVSISAEDSDSALAEAETLDALFEVAALDYGGPDSCVNSDRVVCAYDTVYKVPRWTFYVTSLATITVKTYNLFPLEDAPRVDTLLYLMKCDSSACTSGQIVAINDDGNFETPDSWDSKIVYTPTSTGYYLAVATAYYQGFESLGNISIQANGQAAAVHSSVFGGYHVQNKTIKPQDILFVGRNNDGVSIEDAPEYHDSVMYVLGTMSTGCTTGACGPFLFNDDRSIGTAHSYFSRIDVPTGFSAATSRVVTGVFSDYVGSYFARLNARVFHHRRHSSYGGGWTTNLQLDMDLDGLTCEIEDQIGTCDSVFSTVPTNVGIEGYSCYAFAMYINVLEGNAWSASDSDNDGLRDDWEVYMGGVSCDQAPQLPYNNPGDCEQLSFFQSSTCPEAKCFVIDLSSLTDPDPTVYDVYLHADYWSCTEGDYCEADHDGQEDHQHSLTADQQADLYQVWTIDPGTCWDGSLPPCTDDTDHDLPYRVQMHSYNGKPYAVRDDRVNYELREFGAPGVHSYFNLWENENRKFTGVFRYTLLAHEGGGQSHPIDNGVGGDRSFVAGNGEERSVIWVMSHEMGHSLGIPDLAYHDPNVDYNDESAVFCPESQTTGPGRCAGYDKHPVQYPLVASLMSYNHNLADSFFPKNYWAPTNSWTDFDGCNWRWARFSKGINESINESSLSETFVDDWRHRKLVQDLFCFDDFYLCNGTNAYHPYCESNACNVNWDALRTEGSPPYFDVQYGRTEAGALDTCDEGVLEDRDEWRLIYGFGQASVSRNGKVRTPYYDQFSILLANFNGGMPISNLAGWPIATDPSNPLTQAPFFPVNTATSPSAGCKNPSLPMQFDDCTVPADCRNAQACTGGVCTCDDDDDCFSAKCVGGMCWTGRGACGCNANEDCYLIEKDEDSCSTSISTCFSSRQSSVTLSSDYSPPRQSVRFQGPDYSNSFKFVDSGSTGPFRSIDDHDEFTIGFDFRVDGYSGTQTTAVMLFSQAFKAYLIKNGSDFSTLYFQIPELRTWST